MLSPNPAISLLLPRGLLEPIWRVNPRAHETFLTMGLWAPLLLAVICFICAFTSYGLFYSRIWGYRLAIALLVANLISDLVNVIFGIEPRAWIGVPIVLLLIWYLRSPSVRGHFRQPD